MDEATHDDSRGMRAAADELVAGGVRVVLVDADGVVQVNAEDWMDRLRSFAPEDRAEEFVDDVFAAERDAMCGRRTFDEVVADVCGRWGLSGTEAGLVDHWRHAVVQHQVLAAVSELRDAGLACHLATNQNDVRAAYLRHDLGYADHFDGMLVSCELGATKDDAAFFAAALEELGLSADRAGEVLLVDDSADHVRRAEDAGLRAVLWEAGDGVDELARRLVGAARQRAHGGVPGTAADAR
jgi:putative hydrolase of the HAD superfamily